MLDRNKASAMEGGSLLNVLEDPAAMMEGDEGEMWKPRKSVIPLLVYTMSNFVFGMICSGLGPTIPWLADEAGVEPEILGWLPGIQTLMCIASGLASGIISVVPRRHHHNLLCVLQLWLGGFFALLPLVCTSVGGLVTVFAFQVLPRPWIGQMTNLLVSELHEDAADSSAALSFSQGGFACGCVAMLLLGQAFETNAGIEMMFYAAGMITAGCAFLFCTLPQLDEKPRPAAAKSESGSQMPDQFTLWCSFLAMLAIGVEVSCGTWLITVATKTGFRYSTAVAINLVFWILFMASRLILAPFICRLWSPRPAKMVISGGLASAACCLPALFWPRNACTVLLAVAGLALGTGPSHAMTIGMVKEYQDLTSVDSALFSVAASMGAGGMPFLMSRVLHALGPTAYFPSLFATCVVLVVLTQWTTSSRSREHFRIPVDEELQVTETEREQNLQKGIPPLVWMYWEQGWSHAPKVCQACVASWEKANPDLVVRKIALSDLSSLLPATYSWPRLWQLRHAQRSDAIRLALLDAYGGIWVDATTFCHRSVMPWLRRMTAEQDFFVFDRSDFHTWPNDPFASCGLRISSFFIASSPGHELTRSWRQRLLTALEDDIVDYFVLHKSFQRMLEDEASKHALFQQVPRISSRHPHVLEYELGFAAPATPAVRASLDRSLQEAPIQKLSWKILSDELFAGILLDPEPSSLSILLSSSPCADISDILGFIPGSCEQSQLGDLSVRERDRESQLRNDWALTFIVPKTHRYGT